MKYFVILLVFVGLIGTTFAQNLGNGPDKLWLPACHVGTSIECNQSSLFHNAISAPFSQSDSVAIGTIIQKENVGENSVLYSINVDFYLKNYQPFDLLTATLNNVTEPQTFPDVLYYNSPIFNEEDLVFVYLTKNDGHYEVLPESFALDKHEVRGPPPTILLTKSPSEDTFKQGEKITVSGEVRKMELVKAAKDGERPDVKVTLHKPYDENSVVFSNLMDIDVDGSYSYSLDTSNIHPGEYELEVNYGPSATGTGITINFNSKYWTPLKQFSSGIPFNEIQCKDGLELVAKMPSAHPKCVKPESVEKLTMRGWATTNKTIELTNPTKYMIEKNNIPFEVQYFIKGATLDDIAHDVDANSIRIALDNSVGGQMVVLIPRELIDAKIGKGDIDDLFFLLIDGEENMFGEKTTDTERTITIWFPKDASNIEIIGVSWT
jgi:hypothetical protein